MKKFTLSPFAIATTAFILSSPVAHAQDHSPEVEELRVYGVKEAFLPTKPSSTDLLGDTVMTTPRSVQVIPDALLDQYKILNLADTARFVSGVTRSGGDRGAAETYIVRGFVQQDAFQDGFRVSRLSDFTNGAVSTDEARIAAVEVLKGPSSILYGRSEPGGVVNYVTKRPEKEKQYALRQDVGNFNYLRTEADINQPLNDAVSLRIIGAYDSIDGEVNGEEFKDISVSPSLLFQPSEHSSWLIRADIQQSEAITGAGLIGPDGDSIFIGDPNNSDDNKDQTIVFTELNHRFNEVFSTTFAAQYVKDDIDRVGNAIFGLNPETFTVVLGVADVESEKDQYALRWTNEIDLSFDIGNSKVESTTVFGFDYEEVDLESFRGFGLPTAFGGSIAPYNPITSSVNVELDSYDETETGLTNTEGFSLLLLETLTIDKLTLQLGLRHSELKGETSFVYGLGLFPSSEAKNEYIVTIPSVSVLYQLTENLSTYYTYTESFNPVFTASSASGASLDPEVGELNELGIKYSPSENILVSAAVFRVTKSDIIGTDPENPLFSVNIGEEEVSGFELDIIGNLTQSLSLSLNYGYSNAEITDDGSDSTAFEGNTPYGTPKQSASLFVAYDIADVEGLSFGGGISYRDEVYGDRENTKVWDGFTQFDVFVNYEIGKFELSLNAKNITDEDIFYANNRDFTATKQYPAQYILTTRYIF